ncbi:RNA polymerase sigma-70 factor, sigma-E family [Thermomonospora echinospora]|uniref:RNA polymerase sigma-70 factor, sigma-E family n=1 Tax=Thermomonospora echinospora TaxID=1992 RepID=A0A1H5UX65_9ACTN|nr:SigE family RNA polymerase sigma factor [Thermomonospora echinospora]SEF79675.1 RNA polymerase sigma-70 factor, sigma-E family [Thermomonospora echinospora]
MADRAEFGQYVAARSERLLRTAYLLCRDWATAEDLVQTVLTKAWLAWDRVGDDPDPYVYRILTNTHVSWWRRRWRGEVPTERLPEPSVPPGPLTSQVEDRDLLWDALGRLGRRERAAVVLRYFADLEHTAIAEILGCSPGTVRGHISRALAKLRADLAVAPVRERT